MKNILFLIFVFFVQIFRATPIPFSPIVRNYTVSDYGAGAQNWAVSQDERGVMYFGNNKGLLEFDGNSWTLHELPTKGVVRSIYIDTDGKIFVGSYEEFGYFDLTPNGELVYHSLKNLVEDYTFHNDEFWTILRFEDKIVFQSFNSLFFYDGHSVKGGRMGKLPLNIFQIRDTCYSQLINSGLAILKDNKLQEFVSRDKLIGNDVIAGFPYGEDAMLLFMRNNGVFLHKNDNSISKWTIDCEKELERYTINRVIQTKDSCYIVGTISNGIYAFNKNGHLLWKINTDRGMSNNTVLGLCCDTDNNIWAVLDDGIAYIQSNSLVYYYEPVHRKIGMVYDILVKDKEAYIASNQGLYYLNGDMPELVSGLEEQTWFVEEYEDQVFCGHNKGTFSLSENKAMLVSNAKGAMCMAEIELRNRKYLLGGTYSHLSLYQQNLSGKWNFWHQLRNFSHMASHIEVDHQNNVWVEHWQKGLYRLRLNDNLDAVENVKAYMALGEVRDSHFTLFKINGRVVFSNGNYFYTYEDMNDTIVPYVSMNEQLSELKNIHYVAPIKGNLYWFVNSEMAYLVSCEMNVFQILHRIPFSLFGKALMEERATVAYDVRRDCSYLCLNNAVARINGDSSMLYVDTVPKKLWISHMSAFGEVKGEKTVFPIQAGNELDPRLHSVKFSLSYPAYNNYNYKVRYKLEGFSKRWTDEGNALTTQYFRLPSGEYTFKAEVYDESGVLAAVELPFRILTPWYSTELAIVIYIFIGLLFLFLLQYVVYHIVKRKKDRVIEQQRILHQAEIEAQEKKIIALENERLEADLRFKSKELAEVVMTNIAHQEFLESLKTEMQQLRLSGQYTRKSLDKLLALVNNNLVSDEESWSMFQTNFDRIHENFFRNLKQQYPDLTSGDLRFCALLRLNMPTKEIAKFLNISVRGVDAARYRLRKKFNLSSEDSLTDFMIGFK